MFNLKLSQATYLNLNVEIHQNQTNQSIIPFKLKQGEGSHRYIYIILNDKSLCYYNLTTSKQVINSQYPFL